MDHLWIRESLGHRIDGPGGHVVQCRSCAEKTGQRFRGARRGLYEFAQLAPGDDPGRVGREALVWLQPDDLTEGLELLVVAYGEDEPTVARGKRLVRCDVWVGVAKSFGRDFGEEVELALAWRKQNISPAANAFVASRGATLTLGARGGSRRGRAEGRRSI